MVLKIIKRTCLRDPIRNQRECETSCEWIEEEDLYTQHWVSTLNDNAEFSNRIKYRSTSTLARRSWSPAAASGQGRLGVAARFSSDAGSFNYMDKV